METASQAHTDCTEPSTANGNDISVFDLPPLPGETAEQARRRRTLWFKIAKIFLLFQ